MDIYPKSVTKECTNIIYNQMNNSFYEIQGKNNNFGIGFFCKIRIKNKNILVLMANYKLIDEEFMENNLGIKIKIHNEFKLIKFGDKRINNFDKDYNLSIIEIKENNEFKINYFEIDESLYEKESQIKFYKETIYIIHQNRKKEISVTYSIIRFINKYEFTCLGNIHSNGTLSPVLNINNNKLIGIYINNQSKNFIKGFFYNIILERFYKTINLCKNILNDINEIDIIIKIYKEDVNKKIYFLGKRSEEVKDNNFIKNNNDDYFNELNTEIYIDGRLHKYINYFNPYKEGEYKIKLLFHINFEDCSYMFAGCENIIKIDFISFNTFFVKKMNHMFHRCINLRAINLLSFDITNVIDMSYMFSECENLVNLDLSSFSNKKEVDICNMFYCCKNLRTLDLSNFNFKNDYSYNGIFYNCENLKIVNLSNSDIKKFDNFKDIFFFSVKNIIYSNLDKRKQDLLFVLLYNAINVEQLLKINEKEIENKFPFLQFISRFDNSDINSNFILISNDIILVPKKHIYNNKGKLPNSFSFIHIGENIDYSLYNFIIENSDYDNNYSIIKVINKKFLFEKYFKLPNEDLDGSDIKSREKFYINDRNQEESLDINISDNKINIIKNYHPHSPIYIKKANQLYLIGIINEKNELYYFNSKELSDIKKKIENIELKLKFYQIKKLDLRNLKINDSDINFIFQYDFTNLEYLNLENNNLTSGGIKVLENESLINIKYLNLSNNDIDDKGLTYLNYLSNLNELILLNMPNLSNDYFSSLQSNSFIDNISILKCDKNQLTLKYVNRNYNEFFLPNLNCLKFISSNYDFLKSLKILITFDNICSRIIYLDLSNIGITDEEIIILTENISTFKKIQEINIINHHLTSITKKYLEQLEHNNIKIKLVETRKNKYKILLGGSTISGKTTYFNSILNREFSGEVLSTISGEKERIRILNNVEFYLWDCARWGGRFGVSISKLIKYSDSIILLFDISNMGDFDNLPSFISMIKEFHNLEDFPILLIGNKCDLDIKVFEDEINELLKKEKFIGYFEVSCKTRKNVEESINFIINYIYEKEKQKLLSKNLVNICNKK